MRPCPFGAVGASRAVSARPAAGGGELLERRGSTDSWRAPAAAMGGEPGVRAGSVADGRGACPFAAGGEGCLATVGAPSFSPSASSTAIGVLTLTPSVPSAISSFDTLPSSTASTSMVALSVSISAMMSPGLMVWPSLTSHLASLPSSMVGDSAGIRISVGMVSLRRRLGQRSADPTPSVALLVRASLDSLCKLLALALTQPTNSSATRSRSASIWACGGRCAAPASRRHRPPAQARVPRTRGWRGRAR